MEPKADQGRERRVGESGKSPLRRPAEPSANQIDHSNSNSSVNKPTPQGRSSEPHKAALISKPASNEGSSTSKEPKSKSQIKSGGSAVLSKLNAAIGLSPISIPVSNMNQSSFSPRSPKGSPRSAIAASPSNTPREHESTNESVTRTRSAMVPTVTKVTSPSPSPHHSGDHKEIQTEVRKGELKREASDKKIDQITSSLDDLRQAEENEKLKKDGNRSSRDDLVELSEEALDDEGFDKKSNQSWKEDPSVSLFALSQKSKLRRKQIGDPLDQIGDVTDRRQRMEIGKSKMTVEDNKPQTMKKIPPVQITGKSPPTPSSSYPERADQSPLHSPASSPRTGQQGQGSLSSLFLTSSGTPGTPASPFVSEIFPSSKPIATPLPHSSSVASTPPSRSTPPTRMYDKRMNRSNEKGHQLPQRNIALVESENVCSSLITLIKHRDRENDLLRV